MSMPNMSSMQFDPVGNQFAKFSGDIPAAVSYGIKPASALLSQRVVRNFQVENQGTFTPNNNVLRINVVSSGFLDLKEARLCFDLTVSGPTAIQLDGGAQCIIQRIRILSATGNEVERIEGYNLIAPVLDQYQGNQWDMYSKSICGGNPAGMQLKPSSITSSGTATGGTAAASAFTATGTSVTVNRAGGWVLADNEVNTFDAGVFAGVEHTFGAVALTALTQTNVTMHNTAQELDLDTCDSINNGLFRSYQIPLTAMGWFNPDLGKLLPPGVPFVVEITLAPAGMCMTNIGNTTAIDYNITNTLLKVPNVIINDPGFLDSMGQLKSAGYEWTAQTYKLYTNVVVGNGAGGTQRTVQISDRSRSLNALIGIARETDLIQSTAVNCLKLCKRSLQYLRQWQYTIGSDLYPPQPIYFKVLDAGTATTDPPITSALTAVNIADAWTEAKKVFGNGGIITRDNFADSMRVGNNGTGVFCVDLQSYHQDRRLTSGIDTSETAKQITLRFTDSAYSPANGLQIDLFARCDITFVLVPGTGELRSML